jgi:hypothetical protein
MALACADMFALLPCCCCCCCMAGVACTAAMLKCYRVYLSPMLFPQEGAGLHVTWNSFGRASVCAGGKHPSRIEGGGVLWARVVRWHAADGGEVG